jgi:hypothetical protein
MFIREVRYISNQKEIIQNPTLAAEVRENVLKGDVYIAQNVYSKELVEQFKTYLTGIGMHSFPNYKPIERGCPNFHRINVWDERAFVKGCFHQFVFFPWNQDIFNLFELAKEVYQVKNIISNNPVNKFLGKEPEEDCIGRLAFQFYPSGIGGLNKHQDPVDHHQIAVPTLTMSKKGVDFHTGGAYVEQADGKRVYLDEITEPGDVIYFNATMFHGVENIDVATTPNWLSFKGRWMLLFATNKLSSNAAISNAVDLESKK